MFNLRTRPFNNQATSTDRKHKQNYMFQANFDNKV